MVGEGPHDRLTIDGLREHALLVAFDELARAIGEAAHGWQIEQLQTEEGRLDEVFRSITMPDTVKEDAK
jgi:hypothetical protein